MKMHRTRPMTGMLVMSLAGAMLLTFSAPAQAALIFNIQETGTGVTATGTGSFSFGGSLLPVTGALGGGLVFPSSFSANLQIGSFIPANGVNVTYSLAPLAIVPGGPTSFGPGLLGPLATNNSGDSFGFAAAVKDVLLPLNYVSGTPLSGQSTWPGETLSSLGLTPGSYFWSTSHGGVNDSISLTITPVPEPSSLALLAVAGSPGLMRVIRRQRNATKAGG